MGIFDLFKKKKTKEIFTVEGDDLEMEEAIEMAQVTLMTNPLFYGESIGDEDSAIKVKFPTDEGFEHIWCGNVSCDLDNLLFTCYVQNEPQGIDISQEDKVRVGVDQITDWYVGLKDGILGGHTLRV